MGERLASPPLIEALCEFFFGPPTTWDWTLPGSFYAQIRDEFPDKTQKDPAVTFRFHGSPTSIVVPPTARFPERVQFSRRDGSAMVQVAPNLLVVNHLRPYEDWERFRELIVRMFTRYSSLMGPWKVQRTGLRYINRLPLPGGPRDLSDVVTVVSQSWSGLQARTLSRFYQKYELEYDDPTGTLVHQTGTVRDGDEESAMLDLHFISECEVDDVTVLVPWLDQAHDRIGEAFVASLHPDYHATLKREE